MKEKSNTVAEFMSRAAEVFALDGQFMQGESGVEIYFPDWSPKRFIYKKGVDLLDQYINKWRAHYFRSTLNSML